MKKVESFLESTKSSSIALRLFGVIALITVIYLSFAIPTEELKNSLQGLAQLNVTVAIGIGTLAIALRTENTLKNRLIMEILVILMISIFSFFLSYFDFPMVQRGYFCLSGLIIISILIMTGNYIMDSTGNRKDKRSESNRKKK
ncbi:hypothetical protein JSQ81_02505 [Sporosarcina sp. Marseille-Q4063]|uniref:hypothetical protein n=1 Tax=Sporosarcina sp. Marseille-Q4063 TaxID=2810514 RepID=UPI001BB04652|nr:hypothetical protein [Sporosarcina sp. Marseille-Q4063]QUW22478.1 hypothetical protein JSQ81_02505 [Sporosarcina sp. Marseille-Q4063]